MKNKNFFFNLSVLIAMLFAILFTFGCSDDGKDGNTGGSSALAGTTWRGNYGSTIKFLSNTRGEYSYDGDVFEFSYNYNVNESMVYVQVYGLPQNVPYSGGNTFIFDEETFTKVVSGGGDISSSLVGTWSDNNGYGYSYVFNSNGTGIQYNEYYFTWGTNGNIVILTFGDGSTEEFVYGGGNTFIDDYHGYTFTKQE